MDSHHKSRIPLVFLQWSGYTLLFIIATAALTTCIKQVLFAYFMYKSAYQQILAERSAQELPPALAAFKEALATATARQDEKKR